MPTQQKEINFNLITAIYQNLQTAKQSINNVIEKINDTKLKKELKRQFKDYDELSESCEDLARVYEIELADNNFFKKAKMWLNVNMATLMDKSNRKIASITIIGSTMGVIDLMSVLSDCKKGKKEFLTLGRAVLDLEERNIEKLKPFILIDPKKDQRQEVQEELKQTDGEEPTYVETSSPTHSQEYKQKSRSKNKESSFQKQNIKREDNKNN